MSTNSQSIQVIRSYLADEALLAGQLDRNRAILFPAGDVHVVCPRGLVLCSIWEYDRTFLSIKMFERALEALVAQSRASAIDLDFIIVINNGGSKEASVRQELSVRMPSMIQQKLSNYIVETVTTTPPVDLHDPTTPWSIRADLSRRHDRVSESEGKALLVFQPCDSMNQGKISALRDMAEFLKSQIVDGSYYVDFVFQMDAETILRFSRAQRIEAAPPFGELYKFFHDNDYTAVGTRDRFAIFDPETGRPLSRPVGTMQISWEIQNSESTIIALPGGATLAKASSYVAALIQLTQNVPGPIAEDYAYAKLLRHSFAYVGKRFEDYVALHPGIEHLNRTPSDTKAAFRQIETWKVLSNAVDSFFPGEAFVPMGFMRASLLLVLRRIRDTRYYGFSSLAKLLQDLVGALTAYRIANSSRRPNFERNRMD